MDFLGLDKKVEDENVPIEHLDYGYVEKCTDANELHSILRVLKSGREGRYFELEKFVEQRMMDVMSPEDRSKYIALTVDPSRDEVRTAASDVADFVSQVKADDAELASSGSVSNIARPPRSATTATLSANATPKPVTDASQSAPQRVDWKQGDMASYYEKWGSFNPDEESSSSRGAAPLIQELSADERAAAEARRQAALRKLNIATDPASMAPAARSRMAENEKQKGNDAFRAKEYKDAITFYSRALQYVPGAPVILSNRAMAYIKASQWSLAEADCDAALQADNDMVKAWVRRGTARSKQGKYAGAMADLQRATQLAPDRKDVAKMLKQAKAKFAEVEGDEAKAVLESQGVQGVLDAIAAGKKWGGGKAAPAPAAAAPAPAAYKRVAIADDSDSDASDAEDAPRGAADGGISESKRAPQRSSAAKQAAPAPAPAPSTVSTSFTRVTIEEADSDDSDFEDAPAPAPAPAPKAAPAPAPAPEAAPAPAPAPAVPQAWLDAEAAKADGNAAFVSGQVALAARHYGKSLALQPLQPAAHSNMGFAQHKLGRFAEAVESFDEGLKQLRYVFGAAAERLAHPEEARRTAEAAGKPATHPAALAVKLLFRKAMAQRALGRLREALECLSEVMRLEPINHKAMAEMSAISEQLEAGTRNAAASRAEAPSTPPSGAAVAADAPPPLPQSPNGSTASASTAVPSPMRGVIARTQAPSTPPPAPTPANTPVPPSVPSGASAGAGGTAGSTARAGTPLSPSSTEEAVVEAAKRVVAERVAAGAVKLPDPPRSTYELEAAVSALAGDRGLFAQYLLTCVPKTLRKCLQRPVELDALGTVLSTLAEGVASSRPKFSVNLARVLGEVPGFDTMALMLGDAERSSVRAILEAGKAAGSKASALEALVGAYKL